MDKRLSVILPTYFDELPKYGKKKKRSFFYRLFCCSKYSY